MIMSTARDFIKPEYIEEYIPLIKSLIEKTRKENGNISYTLYSDMQAKGEYVLIEEWENQESLDKHFKTEHFTTIVPKIQKLQVKPSVVNVYEKVNFENM